MPRETGREHADESCCCGGWSPAPPEEMAIHKTRPQKCGCEVEQASIWLISILTFCLCHHLKASMSYIYMTLISYLIQAHTQVHKYNA